MTQETLQDKSRFLSFVLRHRPEAIGITLDKDGWIDVDVLLKATQTTKTPLTLADLREIVGSDSKGRYSFTPDEKRVRANQGHSTSQVRLTFTKGVPPPLLYHGADNKALGQIMRVGLLPMKRHYVHLSADLETAQAVGGRRRAGYTVLQIDAARMVAEGLTFFVSDNGVWLIEAVPSRYLKELRS